MNKGVYSQPTVLSRVVRMVWVIYTADILVSLALVVVPCTVGSALQLSVFRGIDLNLDPVSVGSYNGSMLESNVTTLLISKVTDEEISLVDTTLMCAQGHLSKSDIRISLDHHLLQSRFQYSSSNLAGMSNSLWLIREQSSFAKTTSTAFDRLNIFFVLKLNFQVYFCLNYRSILLSVLLIYWVCRSSKLQLLILQLTHFQVNNFYSICKYTFSVLQIT